MRIVFDHGTPSRIAEAFRDHAITEAIHRVWDRISNGELLSLAEEARLELLRTTDNNLCYQQNLSNRKLLVVVLGNSTWRYVRLHLDRVCLAPRSLTRHLSGPLCRRVLRTTSHMQSRIAGALVDHAIIARARRLLSFLRVCCNTVMKSVLMVCGLMLSGSLLLPAVQDTVGQDLKNAGKDTGAAAKKVGKKTAHGTKKAAVATKNGVQKGTSKAAGATAKGASKVEQKTDPNKP